MRALASKRAIEVAREANMAALTWPRWGRGLRGLSEEEDGDDAAAVQIEELEGRRERARGGAIVRGYQRNGSGGKEWVVWGGVCAWKGG